MIPGIASALRPGLAGLADKDELSDGDDNPSAFQASKSEPIHVSEDYFTQELADFSRGLSEEESKVSTQAQSTMKMQGPKTSYLERCKTIGRLGPPRTELDRESAYGEFEFGHEIARSQNEGAEPRCTRI